MLERFNRKSIVAAGVAVLATLGVGGAAVAQSGGQTNAQGVTQSAPGQSAEVPGQESNAPENSATDTDNVQQGDQTASDANEKAEGPESANEKAEGPEAPGAESAPDDDGPGGWADEPGNPNADTQQQGQH